jgi:hypothetical protein
MPQIKLAYPNQPFSTVKRYNTRGNNDQPPNQRGQHETKTDGELSQTNTAHT